MLPPSNHTEIENTRIALRIENYTETVFNHYWRRDLEQVNERHSRSLHRRWEYNHNERTYPELMLSAESLELKILPGENSEIEALNFTWTMKEYTSEYIWIQIDWEFPPRLSEHMEEVDTLEIYFWGNEFDFFYSQERSKEVRYGTRLEVPIIRQLDYKQAKGIGGVTMAFKILIYLALLLMIMMTGRLLPTWMFINSLCLICHTQYFKTNMPGFVAIFLTELLNVPRFNLVP